MKHFSTCLKEKNATVNGNVYSVIAPYYDHILKHVDYNGWYKYIRTIMMTYLSNPENILEIGCGTGKFCIKFSNDDFNIFGMDLSLMMLEECKARSNNNFSVFCADVRNFRLSKKFDFIFSVHDTLNYLQTQDDLKSALMNVKDNLNNDGIFLFDLTTEYNILKNFESQTETFNIGKTIIEWKNSYNKSENIIKSFLKVISHDGTIQDEVHTQKIYTQNEVIELILECGYKIENIYGDFTFEKCNTRTVMMNFIVRKV